MIRVLGVCLILALAACGTGGALGSPGSDDPLAGRSFESTAVSGWQLVEGSVIAVRFKRDGEITARAACNHLSGDFSLDGETLVVREMTQTNMGCDPPRHAQDEWLSDFLRNRPTWRLGDADLVLRKGGTEIRFVEQTEPSHSTSGDPDGSTSTRLPSPPAASPLALPGRRWRVTGYALDGPTVTVSSAVSAYLEFDGAGRVGGNGGCNGLGGPATINGDQITFGPIAATKMACGSERDAVERAVLTVLDAGRATARVDDVGRFILIAGQNILWLSSD
jgi:heat shock protein HslJ